MASSPTSRRLFSSSSASSPPKDLLTPLPPDVAVEVMTYLRAYDLGSLQQTCSVFASKELAHRVVRHVSAYVYPSTLTEGFTSPNVASVRAEDQELTYQNMRDMEMLVVARVLSRPDAKDGFYVSKSWCRSALKWLDANGPQKRSSRASLSKKKGRIRDRRLSDALPPWPDVNIDIICEHGEVREGGGASGAC